jgi:hypothetical protein
MRFVLMKDAATRNIGAEAGIVPAEAQSRATGIPGGRG